MTAEELINELKKYPSHMIVTDGCNKIEEVSIIEEYYDEEDSPCYDCDHSHCNNCLYSGRIPE